MELQTIQQILFELVLVGLFFSEIQQCGRR
jgi:hypothetical protein